MGHKVYAGAYDTVAGHERVCARDAAEVETPHGGGGSSRLTLESRQRLCCPIADVRPDSSSWECLKTFDRAPPRPLSSTLRVSTPTIVDLPESTLPITATRSSSGMRPSPLRRLTRMAEGCCSASGSEPVARGGSVASGAWAGALWPLALEDLAPGLSGAGAGLGPVMSAEMSVASASTWTRAGRSGRVAELPWRDVFQVVAHCYRDHAVMPTQSGQEAAGETPSRHYTALKFPAGCGSVCEAWSLQG